MTQPLKGGEQDAQGRRSPFSPRFARAFLLAEELHRSQTRKGSDIPYITHLLAVAALVGDYGGDEDSVISALLHDAAEDQGGLETLARIRAEFGERVAACVAACSDAHTIPKPPWRARKEAHLARYPSLDGRVRLVLAADKVHNARSIARDLRQKGAAVWQRFTGQREGTLWYYRAALDALRDGWDHPILDELADAVSAMDRADRACTS